VPWPPGTMRMLSSTSPACDGGLASEKARLPIPALEAEVDVLAGLECIGSSSSIQTALDGRRQGLDARHRAVEVPHRQVLGVGIVLDLGLDHRSL
jgi:hypothetical protein